MIPTILGATCVKTPVLCYTHSTKTHRIGRLATDSPGERKHNLKQKERKIASEIPHSLGKHF